MAAKNSRTITTKERIEDIRTSGRPRKGAYLKCETCGDEFYVTPCRMRQTERNGNTIRFCSMPCYIKVGDKNPFWGKKHSPETVEKFAANPNRKYFQTGQANPNFVRYAETIFIGKGLGWWKRWLTSHVGQCEECGYSEHKEILEVHHLDLNRDNNTRENLKLLCPNCHQWWHFQRKTGRYKWLGE